MQSLCQKAKYKNYLLQKSVLHYLGEVILSQYYKVNEG